MNKQFKELINLSYPLPPRNVVSLVEKLKKKYKTSLIQINKNKKLIGMVMLIKLGNGIYGISTLCIHPKYRGKGYAKKLMDLAHQKKGIFLLRTRIPEFYEKLGYRIIFESEKRFIMAYTKELTIDF